MNPEVEIESETAAWHFKLHDWVVIGSQTRCAASPSTDAIHPALACRSSD
jgi:hypothetical protein